MTTDAPAITGIVAKVPTITSHPCPNCDYVYDESFGYTGRGLSSLSRTLIVRFTP